MSAAWRFLLDENSDPKTASHLVEDDIHAEHVRDALGQGADEEADLLPYATSRSWRVTRAVSATCRRVSTGVVLVYDDTMPASRVASALRTVVETDPSRAAFGVREELDQWM